MDCDLVISDGQCTYGAVTDNWPTIEPYFNETGSNCPSILSVAVQKELLDLAVSSCQVGTSLGFGFWGSGLGFRFWGSGFGFWCSGFGVWGMIPVAQGVRFFGV